MTSFDSNEKLVCSSCGAIYLVIQDIPILLNEVEDEVSKIINEFYDSEWKRSKSGILSAKVKHEDLSELGQRYIQVNETRFLSLFEAGGKFFLDAASGAQPRINFGKKFSYHICVDFSLDGLIESRQLLGERAICVCGSLLNLPLKCNVCDGIIVSHCLYHVDAVLQKDAIAELARVLHSHRKMLIFYGNSNSLEARLVKNLKKLLRKSEITKIDKTFYYYAHSIDVMLNMLSSEFHDSVITVKPLRMFSRRISARLFRTKLFAPIFFNGFILIENILHNEANVASYVAYIVNS